MDKIVCFEDTQGVPWYSFLQSSCLGIGGRDMPPLDDVRGEVYAYVNHGRWVVECINSCGDAMVVSKYPENLYICSHCVDGWFVVKFPEMMDTIEAILLRRPAVSSTYAANRNWNIKETTDQLLLENTSRGLDIVDKEDA